jgi:hypothetical protein
VSCLKRSQVFKGFVRLTHVLYCNEPLHELRYRAHAVAAADVAVAAAGCTHGGLSTAGVEEGWAGVVVGGWVAWLQMGWMACPVLHRLGAGVGCRSVVKVAARERPALNQSGASAIGEVAEQLPWTPLRDRSAMSAEQAGWHQGAVRASGSGHSQTQCHCCSCCGCCDCSYCWLCRCSGRCHGSCSCCHCCCCCHGCCCCCCCRCCRLVLMLQLPLSCCCCCGCCSCCW